MRLTEMKSRIVCQLADEDRLPRIKKKVTLSPEARKRANERSAEWRKNNQDKVKAQRVRRNLKRRKTPLGFKGHTEKQKIAFKANWKLARTKNAKLTLIQMARDLEFELTAIRIGFMCDQILNAIKVQRDKDIKELEK